jgi:drug/metabolite transporter (DMT)-like permease
MKMQSHPAAIIEALLVAIIWASSFVFVKMALAYMGPFTIAGLRYFLGFLILLPFMVPRLRALRGLPPRLWIRLIVIGIVAYTIANGAFYVSLRYLPAVTLSFVNSLGPLLVLFAGVVWLQEIPARLQVIGVVICLVGGALFFSPGLRGGEPLGMAIAAIGMISFVAFGILAREIARDRHIDALSRTAIPLAVGGVSLLLIAIPLEGLPTLTLNGWAIVLWLALVNTSLAYVLYNHSLQELTALEMNVLLNLCPLGAALLAWLLLGETLTAVQILGVIVVIFGVTLVQQMRPR